MTNLILSFAGAFLGAYVALYFFFRNKHKPTLIKRQHGPLTFSDSKLHAPVTPTREPDPEGAEDDLLEPEDEEEKKKTTGENDRGFYS